MRHGAIVLAAIGALLAALPAHGQEIGDAERGEHVFQRCFACHSVDPSDATQLQGPNLYGVVGRRAASLPGYEYSSAMLKEAEQGLVWDAPTLNRYLQDPEALVPGTVMSMPPLRAARDRADLVAYLLRANSEAR